MSPIGRPMQGRAPRGIKPRRRHLPRHHRRRPSLPAPLAVRQPMTQAAWARRLDPDRLSFMHAVRVIKRKMPQAAASRGRSNPRGVERKLSPFNVRHRGEPLRQDPQPTPVLRIRTVLPLAAHGDPARLRPAASAHPNPRLARAQDSGIPGIEASSDAQLVTGSTPAAPARPAA